ncbi:hypothetical protein [Solibacillus sp. NPDC093137]|uniref:hypothetical protein n=1 Tax=Solibacillus sp. NPDC093137 TaxID=3390678 RepID=UPI003CFE4421
MKFEVLISVEKVISKSIEASTEEEAIEKATHLLMTGKEDFATILDISVTEGNIS